MGADSCIIYPHDLQHGKPLPSHVSENSAQSLDRRCCRHDQSDLLFGREIAELQELGSDQARRRSKTSGKASRGRPQAAAAISQDPGELPGAAPGASAEAGV